MSILNVLVHLILKTALWGRHYFYPNLTNKENGPASSQSRVSGRAMIWTQARRHHSWTLNHYSTPSPRACCVQWFMVARGDPSMPTHVGLLYSFEWHAWDSIRWIIVKLVHYWWTDCSLVFCYFKECYHNLMNISLDT